MSNFRPAAERLINRAARQAKGARYLCHKGSRCLWGETYHILGVRDERMEGRAAHFYYGQNEPLGQAPLIDGASTWDYGQAERAKDSAIRAIIRLGGVRKLRRQLIELGVTKPIP